MFSNPGLTTLLQVTIGGPMIKRVTDDAREDEMEENLNQVCALKN